MLKNLNPLLKTISKNVRVLREKIYKQSLDRVHIYKKIQIMEHLKLKTKLQIKLIMK